MVTQEQVSKYEFGYAGTRSYMGGQPVPAGVAQPSYIVYTEAEAEPTKLPMPTGKEIIARESERAGQLPGLDPPWKPAKFRMEQVERATQFLETPTTKAQLYTPYRTVKPQPDKPWRETRDVSEAVQVASQLAERRDIVEMPAFGALYKREMPGGVEYQVRGKRELDYERVRKEVTGDPFDFALFTVSPQKFGGVITLMDVAEVPMQAFIETKKELKPSEMYLWDPKFRKTYKKKLKQEREELGEYWLGQRIERKRMYEEDPKTWLSRELIPPTTVAAFGLAPEIASFLGSIVPLKEAITHAKFPLMVGVGTYGAFELSGGIKKMERTEPGALSEIVFGAAMLGYGVTGAVKSGKEILKFHGDATIKSVGLAEKPMDWDVGRFQKRTVLEEGIWKERWRPVTEPKLIQYGKYKGRMAPIAAWWDKGVLGFGETLKFIGEWPKFVPEYTYFTKETRGFEKQFKASTKWTEGIEYAGGYEVEGVYAGEKWLPAGTGKVSRVLPTDVGAISFEFRPVEHAYYKGLRPAKTFDIVGFTGGVYTEKGLALETVPTMEEVGWAIRGRKVPEGFGTQIFMEKPISRFEIPIYGKGPPSRAYPYWTKSFTISKGEAFMKPLESFLPPEDMFQRLVDVYPKSMFRVSGMKTYVGATEFMGTDPLLKMMPKDSQFSGVMVERFVKGPRPYKPTILPPSRVIGAAPLDWSALRKEMFVGIMKDIGIPVIGEGQMITIGAPAAVAPTVSAAPLGMRLKLWGEPKLDYVSAPIFTARIPAPGEPAIPGYEGAAAMTGIGLGLGRVRPSKAERITFVMPKAKVGMLPDMRAALRPMTQPRLESMIQPMLKPMLRPRLQPRLEPRLEPMIEPMLQPMLRPMIQPKVQPKVRPKIITDIIPEIVPVVTPVVPRFEVPRWPRRRKPRRRKGRRPRRRFRYTPTILGMARARGYGVTLPRAPKFVGVQAVGIRPPVARKRKKRKAKRKTDKKRKRRYERNFLRALGI